MLSLQPIRLVTAPKHHRPKAAILDQISVAFRPGNRLALAIAGVLGGFIPLASYVIAHYETSEEPMKWGLVAAGLAYSGLTVFDWARIAFSGNIGKSLGFVVLLEGISIFANTQAIAIIAVVSLMMINAVATSTNLINDRKDQRALGRSTAAPARARKRTRKGG